MAHFVYWVILLIAGWPQDSTQNVGTKVVWRSAAGDTAGSETTIYTMGDRRRTEYRNTALKRDTLKEPLHPADPPANVVIERCDLGQAFELNTHTKEYDSQKFPPSPGVLKWNDEEPDWNTSILPAQRVETTTADTGESDLIFGQVARHVAITVKVTPLPNPNDVAPSVYVRDGWYIDYQRRLSCEPPAEVKTHDFSFFFAGGHRMFMGRIENVTVGKREEGLLIRNGPGAPSASITRSDGKETTTMSNATKVAEFYRGPLDPDLFEVPADFKVVDKIGWAPIK